MSVFRTAAILALIAQPLVADEVWDTDMGPIVYQAEEAGTAIFTFTNVDAYPATLIIPGLAGNYGNRSTHEAMWIGQGSGECETFMTPPQAASGGGRVWCLTNRPIRHR